MTECHREREARLGARESFRVDGTTLVELMVVLALLGLITTLGAIGVVSLRPPANTAFLDSVRSRRAKAIRSGKPEVLRHDSLTIRFLPDGRVIGGPLDPFTGEPHDAP